MGRVSGICRITSCTFLDQNVLATSLDILVKHHTQIGQSKAAHVEAEEFGGVSCTELQTNVGGGGMFESRIFNLLSDLI